MQHKVYLIYKTTLFFNVSNRDWQSNIKIMSAFDMRYMRHKGILQV